MVVAGVALVAGLALVVGAAVDRGLGDRRDDGSPLAERMGVRPATAPGEDPVARENRPTQLAPPDPADHRVGSARRAAAEFLDAWHDRAWNRMAVWTAPLWRENLPDPAASLRFRFGAARLRGTYQRSLRRTDRDRASLVVDLASTDLAPEVDRRRVTMDLRRVNGRWGVEPTSIVPPTA